MPLEPDEFDYSPEMEGPEGDEVDYEEQAVIESRDEDRPPASPIGEHLDD
jgi:hypothetical protein